MHERKALVRPTIVVVVDAFVLGVDDTGFAEDEWPADDEHAAPARSSAAIIVQNPSFVVPRRYAD